MILYAFSSRADVVKLNGSLIQVELEFFDFGVKYIPE